MTRVRSVLALLLALAAAGVLAVAVLADTPPAPTTTADTTTTPAATTAPAPAVLPDGVVLAGLAVGGLSPDAAVAAVEQEFGQPLQLRYDTTRISISPSLLGMSVPAAAAVAKALTVAPGTTLTLRAAVDQKAIAAFVGKIGHRFDRKPVSSRLLLRNFRPVVTPSVAGRTIDVGATARAVTDQLVHGTRATIVVPVKLGRPAVTEQTIGPVILIRRGANRLTLYNGAKVVRTFEVATGQTIYPTPLGQFRIVVKWKNPWWYPPASPWAAGEKPVPPGPGNPLGTRWMGLSAPGVGIHGTPEAGSIGYSLSHGCIRMLIPQAEWLFDHVDVGTPVFIVST